MEPSSSGRMALEDDRVVNIAPDPAQNNPTERFKKNTFVFQPVEGNMAHHSLLGEQPVRFDFMAKPIIVVDGEYDQHGTPQSITIALSRCAPSTCTLRNIPFQDLSRSLYVWYDSEPGIRVDAVLSLGSTIQYLRFWFLWGAQPNNRVIKFNKSMLSWSWGLLSVLYSWDLPCPCCGFF